MPHECGSEALVNRARAWASNLTSDCPSSLESALDASACRLAGYYRDIGKAQVTAFPVRAAKSVTALGGKELIEMYRAKQRQQ